MDTIINETSHRFLSNDDAYYVLDENAFRTNIRNMRKAFESRYPNFRIAYSLKTNYLRRICEIAKEEGCYAEVVSYYEHEYAQDIGFGHDIIYNGVCPFPEYKERVAERGEIVNVDNLIERDEIIQWARKRERAIKLGVRVNFDVMNGVVSRFGTDIFGREFEEMMRYWTDWTADTRAPRFAGFHCHIGTARPLEYWVIRIAFMAVLAKRYHAEYIDIGGGMFGKMTDELAKQFPGYVADFDAYAEPICKIMNCIFPKGECKLIVEPGTALVGNAMAIEAKVTNIKEVRGKTFITVACNSNHTGIIADNKKLPIAVLQNPDVKEGFSPGRRCVRKDACIAGNTCMEFDYIRQHADVNVGVGDYIRIENVGAYSISSSRQFIVPRLPVYNTDGELLREEEGYWDMFGLYVKAGKKE